MGAFVFAAQMINFPVAVETGVHLFGAALLACTLGPAAAAVTITAILAIQALVFQDGGILALGAKVMNLALYSVPCPVSDAGDHAAGFGPQGRRARVKTVALLAFLAAVNATYENVALLRFLYLGLVAAGMIYAPGKLWRRREFHMLKITHPTC